jgi:hypothetical protein
VSIKGFKARALSNTGPTFVESRFGKHSSITVGCGLEAEKDVGIFHVDRLAGMFCDGSWALSEFAVGSQTKKGRCINSGQKDVDQELQNQRRFTWDKKRLHSAIGVLVVLAERCESPPRIEKSA